MGYHPSNIFHERKKHQIIKLTNDLAVPIVRTDCLLFNSRLAAEDAIRVALVDNMFISMYGVYFNSSRVCVCMFCSL